MASQTFDVAILGSGPGGYIAAIRASQLGKKVVLIEEEKLGGVCLNKGCIPTKAILKSAQLANEVEHLKDFGVEVELKGLSGARALARAREISSKISRGVSHLMKKNNITVAYGTGQARSPHTIEVKGQTYKATNIILATGAYYRTFPGLAHDGKRLIGAWEALAMKEVPSRVAIIGGGAIGVEFAYFWKAFGAKAHIFEVQPHLLPLEDEDCSRELERSFRSSGITLSLGAKKVQAQNHGPHITVDFVEQGGGARQESFDLGLIAVGMIGRTQQAQAMGVEVEGGFIKTNSMGQTNLPHVYAIGDVAGPPLLAHAASHEGVIAAEHLAGLSPRPLDRRNIPSCTYAQPQVASVGWTERELKKEGLPYKVGKLPFSANGKALAAGQREGFVKTLLGPHGELLGAHIVGPEATELIAEYTLFRTMEGVSEEMLATVHPHPTLGEWLAESVMAAEGHPLNF